MTTRHLALALTILAGLAIGPALSESPGPIGHSHDTGVKHTVVLDGDDVRPASLEMKHDDTVSFVNQSTDPVKLTFVEPKDLEAKIRCGLVRGKDKIADAPAWALFTWQDGKLVANVPPGQFASLCSLAAGSYAFTAEKIGQSAPASGSAVLPKKGQITVS
jgi:hypothetical protein